MDTTGNGDGGDDIADPHPRSFMPETLRSLVGDGSIPPPPLNMSPPMFWRYRKAQKHGEGGEKVDRPPRKPVRQVHLPPPSSHWLTRQSLIRTSS